MKEGLPNPLLVASPRLGGAWLLTFGLPGFVAGLLLVTLLCPCRLKADTTSLSGATEITSVPCTISQPGVYYLSQNFYLNTATGNGITVNVSGVTIDFNGNTLSNLAAGPGATGAGIYTTASTQVTLRNGTIRGFAYGIYCADPTGSGNNGGFLVEHMRLLDAAYAGVRLDASASIIRHCQASRVGGSTQAAAPAPAGFVLNGSNDNVQDCDVSELATGTTAATTGIEVATGDGLLVSFNRLSGASSGLIFPQNTSSKFRDNLCAASVATPYTNGINVGDN